MEEFTLEHKGGPVWLVRNAEDEIVTELKGKKTEVLEQFEQYKAEHASPEVPEEEPSEEAAKPNLPNPDSLSGRAKTAALNAQVDTTFVEGEYKLSAGVQNEANKVFNVPDGWQPAWATPRHIDGGRHANHLRERGYRPVYRDEMGNDQYEDAMYVAYMDETDSDFVFMGGAQLFIGPSERLAKLRQAEYDAHMAAFTSKPDEFKSEAERYGAQLKTDRSSTYNPMRS